MDSPLLPLCSSADQRVPALQKLTAPPRTMPHSHSLPSLTSARVDEESDHHGRCHHRPPGLHLRLLHAVKDGHAAHVALPGTRRESGDMQWAELESQGAKPDPTREIPGFVVIS